MHPFHSESDSDSDSEFKFKSKCSIYIVHYTIRIFMGTGSKVNDSTRKSQNVLCLYLKKLNERTWMKFVALAINHFMYNVYYIIFSILFTPCILCIKCTVSLINTQTDRYYRESTWNCTSPLFLSYLHSTKMNWIDPLYESTYRFTRLLYYTLYSIHSIEFIQIQVSSIKYQVSSIGHWESNTKCKE